MAGRFLFLGRGLDCIAYILLSIALSVYIIIYSCPFESDSLHIYLQYILVGCSQQLIKSFITLLTTPIVEAQKAILNSLDTIIFHFYW